jgi:hypothetical protein
MVHLIRNRKGVGLLGALGVLWRQVLRGDRWVTVVVMRTTAASFSMLELMHSILEVG